MKPINPLNVEREAGTAIRAFFDRLPAWQIDHIEHEARPDPTGSRVDYIVEVRIGDKPIHLIIEVKSNGQPRSVRDAADQLHRYLRNSSVHGVPIVMAPYLSPRSREVCREEHVGYLDFMGNALIAFDSVYIEREVPGRPEPERRVLRSLFKPKSARILRCLFEEPRQPWRTTALVLSAKVSAGLVSIVGARLRELGWAEQTERGLELTETSELLDSWVENYEPPRGEEHRCYTSLHGSALTDRLRTLSEADGRVALASFSAAAWLAPHVRHPGTYFYADQAGFDALTRVLDLSEAPKGANVTILVPEEDGVLTDAKPVANGLMGTSPLQTYLDLVHAGDRGAEGATLLRGLLDDRA